MPEPLSLFTHPVHLGPGARVLPQPEFTGLAWYADYVARHGDEGSDGRLVSLYTFTESWDSWEMHPAGDELVVCLNGMITLHQEAPDGTAAMITLAAGEYAINAPGVWHTADVASPATVLFVTAGLGTQHRPR